MWPVDADEAFFLEGLKTNRSEMPRADKMVRMAQDILAASDADFAEVLGRWLDLDDLFTHIALDRAMDHTDGILTFYCWGGGHYNHNYYIYEDPLEDRVQIIPWDFDKAFQSPNPYRQAGVLEWKVLPEGNGPCPTFLSGDVALAGCDPIIARLSTILRDRCVTRGQVVLNEAFDVPRMRERIESLALQNLSNATYPELYASLVRQTPPRCSSPRIFQNCWPGIRDCESIFWLAKRSWTSRVASPTSHCGLCAPSPATFSCEPLRP